VLIHVLRAVFGMALLLAAAAAFSRTPRRISPRIVFAALALQIAIGALILFVPPGRAALHAVANGADMVLSYGRDGTAFLFGGLVGPTMTALFGGGGFVFALQVLPQIIYISALIAILYHFGVMQFVARVVGGAVRSLIGTSAIESFSSVLTIFLGQSEMPVALRPYLARLGTAELFTVMCAGPASVAGSVLAGYAALGVPMDYLIAASFMAIPGGLLFAKLLYPSADEPSMPAAALSLDERAGGIFEAISEGTNAGVRVAVAVAAMLVAFVSLIALVDGVLHGVGRWFGDETVSLHGILGFALAPVAWAMGAPWSDCRAIGSLLGQKFAFNEFVAYVAMQPMIAAHMLSARGTAIASFALCGFANISTIGILVGVYGGIVPERRAEIARLAPRAVLGGALSNAMSATIAGLFIG
jgi:concentrative nucleoside transporter, CNT family